MREFIELQRAKSKKDEETAAGTYQSALMAMLVIAGLAIPRGAFVAWFGIDQISKAITQMDDATQQNASLVEEVAAAAQSLQDQAGNLAQVVSVFKLGEEHRVSGASFKLVSDPDRDAVTRMPVASDSRDRLSQSQ